MNVFQTITDLFTQGGPPPRRHSYRSAVFFGTVFLLLAFFALEKIDSFYFVQDDNFAQFFPVMLDACRSVFHDGLFPTMNPYQLGGVPTTGLGTYALTYPVTYLSYAIAAFGLRNEYATLEVFAFLHLLAGYFGCLRLFRYWRIGPALAALGGLSFVLSGFFLIAGRSWFYMLPVAAYLPLWMYGIERLRKGEVDGRWSILMGLLVGISFHSGNAQMWFYTVMFSVVAVAFIFLFDGKRWKKFPFVVGAFLIGLAIAAPLIVWTAKLTAQVPHNAWGNGIMPGRLAMFFPYPLVKAPHPENWNPFNPFNGHLYYNGGFFNCAFVVVLAMFVAGMIFFFRKKQFLAAIYENMWIFMALLAYLLALGPDGKLWPLLAGLPVFNKFTLPLKFIPFFQFFVILSVVPIVDRYAAIVRPGKTLRRIGGAFLFGLLFYHVTCCRTAFFVYADDPYPPLPQEMRSALAAEGQSYPQRIHVRSFLRAAAPDYAQSLVNNFATVYRVLSITGYEPLVGGPALSKESLFQYGVRYLVETRIPRGMGLAAPVMDAPVVAAKSFEPVNFYLLSGARPLAYIKANPQIPLPIRFDDQGATVDTSYLPIATDVVVNMIFRDGFVAFVNGRRLQVHPDEWNRIVIEDCPAAKRVEVRYWFPMKTGFLLAGGLMAMAGIILIIPLRRRSQA
jgi:hypothetical protein